jgi:UTP--glucose-1-phosphate uridylyltransferase
MTKNRKITKAVFPVAGFGTRFLPATKASPKEMLPIVDKPLIQYAVEEAIDAGITDMIFITGKNKRSIEDHFDAAYELEFDLHAKNKHKLLETVRNIIPKHINCIYIRQTEMLGLGHAVLCAKPVINNEAFTVLLADELIDSKPGALKQMMNLYEEVNASILGVNEVPNIDVSNYGIVKIQKNKKGDLIDFIVEKPKQDDAPSNLAVVGRYILMPEIIRHLEKTKNGVGGEIQLTDAISSLLKEQEIYAHKIEGVRYDCGSKLGYLKATVMYGLKHKELSDEFMQFIKAIK